MTSARFRLIIAWGASVILTCACQNNANVSISSEELQDSALLDIEAKENSPVCKVKVNLQKFSSEDKEQDSICRLINQNVNSILFPDFIDDSTSSAAAKYVSELMDDYNYEVRHDYRNDMAMSMYDSTLNVADEASMMKETYSYYNTITTNASIGYMGKVANYIAEEQSYTGGAHPITITTYLNYQLSNGKRILLEEILKEGKKDSLLQMLLEKLMAKAGVKNQEDLQRKGFLSFSEMFITENFKLGKSEILFHYNPYDIAPYSEGDIELSFKYEEVKDILNLNF